LGWRAGWNLIGRPRRSGFVGWGHRLLKWDDGISPDRLSNLTHGVLLLHNYTARFHACRSSPSTGSGGISLWKECRTVLFSPTTPHSEQGAGMGFVHKSSHRHKRTSQRCQPSKFQETVTELLTRALTCDATPLWRHLFGRDAPGSKRRYRERNKTLASLKCELRLSSPQSRLLRQIRN
jgi:hypothetical protein